MDCRVRTRATKPTAVKGYNRNSLSILSLLVLILAICSPVIDGWTGAEILSQQRQIIETSRQRCGRDTGTFAESVKPVSSKQRLQVLHQSISNDNNNNKNNINNNKDPFMATGGAEPQQSEELIRTIGGGTSLIFEMARKCVLDWGNDIGGGTDGATTPKRRKPQVLPRWHPHKGISNANPNFRTQAPIMNNQGFAKSIWRNARKRNKPSLWRHALRTYDRMVSIEEQQKRRLLEQKSGQQRNFQGESVASQKPKTNRLIITRSNIHHEGAMLACAKLGLWERALEIYNYVVEKQIEQDLLIKQKEEEMKQQQLQKQQGNKFNLGIPITKAPPSSASTIAQQQQIRRIYVTDNMISSLIRACVKASKQKQVSTIDSTSINGDYVSQRRIPLDTALDILDSMPELHNIPVVSQHVNPLAAAYQELGYFEHARDIIQTRLSNRTIGEEPYDGTDVLNIHDFSAKDKGSYSLLVRGAVVSGDWADAVDALADMTEAGLYPVSRHCNEWNEISESQSQHRAVGSWKKKRNDYWLESVQ